MSLNILKYTKQKQGDSFSGTWVTTQLLKQGHTIELSPNTLKYAEQKQGDSFNGTWVTTQLLNGDTIELSLKLTRDTEIRGTETRGQFQWDMGHNATVRTGTQN